MSGKYKYMFKFGRGSKTLELLGPSISYFWNDIYDSFDIYREMFVEKLGGNVFSLSEIKRNKSKIPSVKIARYLSKSGFSEKRLIS